MSSAFVVPCRIVLEGASMTVKARNKQEALAKAKRNECSDIRWDKATLVKQKPIGQPKQA